MPLTEQEIHLPDERNRIREEMEDLAEEQANWDGKEEHAQQLLQQGIELENQYNILEHVQDEWDVDTITLAGLTAGEVNRVEDTVEDNKGVRERDAWVAIGTRDGPYLEHDPENTRQDEYEETVGNVTDLPLSYVRWAEAKISELSHLNPDAGNGYLKLVRERQGNGR